MPSSVFQVDLNGVLKVLSDSLYSSYHVFIRELLQNCVDAIKAREDLQEFEPSVTVGFFEEGDIRTLTVEDNGIGLTFAEVDEFLSKIGSSSKSKIGVNRDSFIGQFGIGLLSCFMVSDEVVILTRSAKNGESVKWVGNIDGTYHKELLSEPIETGTRVFLKIRDGVKLDLELLRSLLDRYAAYLAYPVHLDYNGAHHQVIHKVFPWEQKVLNDSVQRLGKERFGERFSNFINLKDRSGKTNGVAYILPRATHFGTVNAHCVYVKRMFITDRSSEVLPDWAFFVRAVINSDNLVPTASREEIYKNTVLEKVREDLGACIKNYLKDLSRHDQQALDQILSIHNDALKSLALKDEKFLEFIAGWFRFQTSEGILNLHAIKKKSKKILYVGDLDQYRQILPVANANKQLIINAGYVYDTELFNKLSILDNSSVYQVIDTEYFGNILNEVPIEVYDRVEKRLEELQFHIQEYGCELQIKTFAPETMPAIFYMSQSSMLERDITTIKEESNDLWANITDSVFDFGSKYKSRLFLNYSNPMVKKLIDGKATASDHLFLEMIYLNSLMMGHYPLNHRELEAMNSNMLKLLEKAL